MRIKLKSADLKLLFDALEVQGYDVVGVSLILGKSRRTVIDWKRGKYTIGESEFRKLTLAAALETDKLHPIFIDEEKRKRDISSLGGKAQWKMNGSIGKLEDRSKGGNASYLSRKSNKLDIFSRNEIVKPRQTDKLAEFIGICMGDGSITDYQVVISLNDEDDKEYIGFVKEFAQELFGLKSKIQKRRHGKCSNVVLSSVELVEFLTSQGLPKGDKIRAGLDIPEWILCDDGLVAACIRGLFDTDGSIYQETHTIKGKKYSYPRWSFVSASDPLRESVYEGLLRLGFEPKMRMNRSVNLERFTDIDKYFRMVGSSNPKHLQRIARFGGVG
jgi:hypothetical protein